MIPSLLLPLPLPPSLPRPKLACSLHLPSHLPTQDTEWTPLPQLSAALLCCHCRCRGCCRSPLQPLCWPSFLSPLGREKGTKNPLSTPEGHLTTQSTSTTASPHPAHPSKYLTWPLSSPRGYSREVFLSGGSRSAQSPDSKSYFIPQTNPPVTVQRWGWTSAAYHHGRRNRRSCHNSTHDTFTWLSRQTRAPSVLQPKGAWTVWLHTQPPAPSLPCQPNHTRLTQYTQSRPLVPPVEETIIILVY
jgi:hypothetical protein